MVGFPTQVEFPTWVGSQMQTQTQVESGTLSHSRWWTGPALRLVLWRQGQQTELSEHQLSRQQESTRTNRSGKEVRDIQLRHELTTDRAKVWLFDVAVIEGKVTRLFTAATDADWEDFQDRIVARMDTPGDPHLAYQISTESRHQWVQLSSATDWKTAAALLAKRALAAQSREVSMNVKDMVRMDSRQEIRHLPFPCSG
jgi:hypothetical protein